jgi:hypothetical protein
LNKVNQYFPRAIGPAGEEILDIPLSPAALPHVTKRDMEQAWAAARDAAIAEQPGPPRGFRFASVPNGLHLALIDPDARCWADAVDRIADLATPHGVSLCVRLLALVELIGRAEWLRPFIAIKRDGAAVSPHLLHAAALARLTDSGGFDETGLRHLLVRPDISNQGPTP